MPGVCLRATRKVMKSTSRFQNFAGCLTHFVWASGPPLPQPAILWVPHPERSEGWAAIISAPPGRSSVRRTSLGTSCEGSQTHGGGGILREKLSTPLPVRGAGLGFGSGSGSD